MNTPATEPTLHRAVIVTALIALLGAAAACDPRHGDPGATEHSLLQPDTGPRAVAAADVVPDAPAAAPPTTISEEYAVEQAALPEAPAELPPPSY